jgi:hypothetical protein
VPLGALTENDPLVETGALTQIGAAIASPLTMPSPHCC